MRPSPKHLGAKMIPISHTALRPVRSALDTALRPVLSTAGMVALLFNAHCHSDVFGRPASTSSEPQPPPLGVPSRPEACVEVPTPADFEAALASAQSGVALCLPDGLYRGRFVVPAGVTVFGTRAAILHTTGAGSTVTLLSRSRLLGVTVDGSGGRFDIVDAGVHVTGEDIEVSGVIVRNSPFGILVEKSHRARIEGNHVFGIGGSALGLRGDGIRLWETKDSVVTNNWVEDARDCVVWYSTGNKIRGNWIERGRYGVHFMYSHENRVEENTFVRNEVGAFIMYSRNIVLRGNWLVGSHGSSGMGLGLKESGNVVVTGNHIVANTQGVFLDNSPLNETDENLFEDNDVALAEIGIGFLSSERANTFRRNVFRGHRTHVRVDGGGDAREVVWIENSWDAYAGYDLDGDGIGDVPFVLRDLGDTLESKYPDLAFLRGTPALALVSVAGEVTPLLAPKTILEDPRPRL